MKSPLALLSCVLLLSLMTREAKATSVGFQRVSIEDPGNPPIDAGIWYPTADAATPQRLGLEVQTVAIGGAIAGTALPLVVMSHGQGGVFSGHVDTSMALAKAGFVAAALTHTGDNYKDHSREILIQDRSRQLRVLVDWMLAKWPGHARLDPARIGAFGFSAGGFAVLVAAGGTPDLSTIGPHCRALPSDFVCGLMARNNADPDHVTKVPPEAWVHDPRIKSAVVAAPALGFAFDKAGLAPVRIPIQLWRAADDHVLPHPYSAEAVAHALPSPPDYQVVSGADHFDFLSPCSPAKAAILPPICSSAAGFDRAAFHTHFDQAIVAFFRATLGAPSH